MELVSSFLGDMTDSSVCFLVETYSESGMYPLRMKSPGFNPTVRVTMGEVWRGR